MIQNELLHFILTLELCSKMITGNRLLTFKDNNIY